MSSDFEGLFHEHALFGLDAMISLSEFQGQDPFEVDLSTGFLVVGEKKASISAVGTWAGPPTSSWLWSWANPGWKTLPASVVTAGEVLKKLGEETGITSFTSSEVPTLPEEADEIGFYFTAIAAGLTGSAGALRYQHDRGSAFFLVQSLSSGTSDHMSRHIRVITQGLQNYTLPHRLAITSYLKQKRYEIADSAKGLLIALRDNDKIEVTFDELDRLANITGSMASHKEMAQLDAPQPAKPVQPKTGFFSKIFKK